MAIKKIIQSDVYKIAPHHRFQWEEAQNCFVILFPEGMIKLNPSAGEILNLVDGVRTVEKVIDSLKEKFKDVENIDKDIISMFEFAIEKSWITKSEG